MLCVLVVDRESDILGLFETILISMGHSVNAQDSLSDMAGNLEYDLVIVDIEFFEQKHKSLLDSYTGSKLCITSVWKESRLPPGINAEYDFFLQKPFKLKALRKILDSVKALSP